MPTKITKVSVFCWQREELFHLSVLPKNSAVAQQGLETGLLGQESSALTIRPPGLLVIGTMFKIK